MTKSQSQSSFLSSFYWLLRLLIILAAIAAAIWCWRLLKDPNFMPIHQIKISTSYEHIDQQSLEQIVVPYVTAQGLFTVDTAGLKQHLLQIPWIYQVLIQRVWPDKIAITITEQQAVAQWNNTSLLNPEADIFTPAASTFPNGLPNLNGPEGQQQLMLEQYHAMSAALAPLQLTIAELNLNSRQSWQMTLNNGMIIFLGRTDVMTKLNRFVSAYPKVFNTPDKIAQSIDLRYPDGLTVSWKNTPTAVTIKK